MRNYSKYDSQWMVRNPKTNKFTHSKKYCIGCTTAESETIRSIFGGKTWKQAKDEIDAGMWLLDRSREYKVIEFMLYHKLDDEIIPKL